MRPLIALLLLPAPALAQSIRGSIVDAVSGAHVAAVNVTLLDRAGNPSYSAVGTADGKFDLALPPGATVRVQFDRIGYLRVTSVPISLRRGQVLDVEVRLSTSAVPLPPITVVARGISDPRVADFYKRAGQSRTMGRGRIWTRDDLEKLGPVPISHVLGTVSSRASCSRSEVYVDGLPVTMRPATGFAGDLARANGVQPAPPGESEAGALVDWLVPPEDVEGIEIYRDSEIPIEFNPNGELCKVTLIWRKSYAEHPGTSDLGSPRGMLLVAVIAALTTFLFSRLR